MNRPGARTISALTFVVGASLAALLVPGSLSPIAAHAQTGTPTTGTPAFICGPVSSYTAATATTTGALSFSNVNTNQTFTLPAGTTFGGTIAAGMNLCLVGTVNSAGQLVGATVMPNNNSTSNLCGAVTAYTPATLTSPGSVTIGGQVISLGLGTTFTGTTLATGSNVCVAANVNGLGVVNGGAVTANTAGTTGSTLISICGPVSSYTAATASAAGTITFSNVGVTATYSIPAGTTTSGNLALATGSNVCLVGTANGTGGLTSATFMPNSTTQVYTCGTVSGYTAATVSAPGTLTVGGTNIPLGLGTTFTGGTVTTGTNQCFTLTINSLGQAVSGTLSTPSSTPLAAVVYSPGSGGRGSHALSLAL